MTAISVDRKEMLHRLLCVEPGTSKQESVQQSNCVVFAKGRLYTFSPMLSCAIPSQLPKDIQGAVNAEKIVSLLKNLPDDLIEMQFEEAVLSIRGHGRWSKLPLQQEMLLPLDHVTLPKTWLPLPANFATAVDLTAACCRRKGDFCQACIAVWPQWLEASDNTRLARYEMTVPVQEPLLIRGESLKVITDLGMTRIGETDDYLHFANPLGLRVSVRKFLMEDYPDLTPFLALRGQPITFPKGLEKAAETAALFLDDGGSVRVAVQEGELTITAISSEGEYGEDKVLKYDGPDMTFNCSPKLLGQLVREFNSLEVTPVTLRADGGGYTLVISLEQERA